MKMIFVVISLTLLAGCSLSHESVELRKKACLSVGGSVKILTTLDRKATSVNCLVEGINYYVNPRGELK